MEQHLRILTVTLEYPPPSFGGYEVICTQVCTWLKQQGQEEEKRRCREMVPDFLLCFQEIALGRC